MPSSGVNVLLFTCKETAGYKDFHILLALLSLAILKVVIIYDLWIPKESQIITATFSLTSYKPLTKKIIKKWEFTINRWWYVNNTVQDI